LSFLYVNTRGEKWTKHSFSAGQDYDHSPLKYYLRRVQGWHEKDNRAAFLFGRAIEDSVRYGHENNGMGFVEKFNELWAIHKDTPDLVYTKIEKDWVTLNRSGNELMRLYVILQPTLPIPIGGGAVFQREYSKEVFPDDPNYSGIEDAGKLDIVAYCDPAHPMLAKLDWKAEYGLLRPLIVDMKTMGKDFPEGMGIAAYDKQLRRYSWQSGIRDVALLCFVKKGHSIKKGSSVTLLVDTPNFKAGTELVVAHVNSEKDGAYLVANDFMLTEMDKAQGIKEDGSVEQTKVAKERKMVWLSQNAPLVPVTSITRQRIQFNSGFVTIESAKDAGLTAARQIVQIVNSWKTKQWPSEFGIRYPQDDRNDPYFRAFVLKDEVFKNQYFIQKDADTFDDFFAEEEGVKE
jgi:hypothetical protein